MLGASVRGFEEEFAAYHGVAHCVGVDNGTNAIKLGLQALGVGPGDEVITVSNTAAPTVRGHRRASAPRRSSSTSATTTYLMDTDQVDGGDHRPHPVPAAGAPVRPVRRHGAAAGARRRARPGRPGGLRPGARRPARTAGSPARSATRPRSPSTRPRCSAPTATAARRSPPTTRSAASLRRLRYYGMEERYYVVETPGHNSRLDEVQAEILRRKLAPARHLHRRPPRGRRSATPRGWPTPTWCCRPTAAGQRARLLRLRGAPPAARRDHRGAARRYDIELNISYPWPVHTMTGLRPPRLRQGLAAGHRGAGRRDLLAADVPVADP